MWRRKESPNQETPKKKHVLIHSEKEWTGPGREVDWRISAPRKAVVTLMVSYF